MCFNVTSKTIQSESIRFRCTNHKLTSSKWTRLSDALADVMMTFVSLLFWTLHTFGGDTTETFLTFCFLTWIFFHVRSFLSFILCLLFLDHFSRHMILKCVLHPISTKQITWANSDALQKIWYVFFLSNQRNKSTFWMMVHESRFAAASKSWLQQHLIIQIQRCRSFKKYLIVMLTLSHLYLFC